MDFITQFTSNASGTLISATTTSIFSDSVIYGLGIITFLLTLLTIIIFSKQ